LMKMTAPRLKEMTLRHFPICMLLMADFDEKRRQTLQTLYHESCLRDC
jgi:hypothetical protein